MKKWFEETQATLRAFAQALRRKADRAHVEASLTSQRGELIALIEARPSKDELAAVGSGVAEEMRVLRSAFDAHVATADEVVARHGRRIEALLGARPKIETIAAAVVPLLPKVEAATVEQGPPGPAGPMPDHKWTGTKLAFEKPDGSWGAAVDLQGPAGKGGGGGSVVVSSGGGQDGQDAGRVLDELVNTTADNVTLTGDSPGMITMTRPGANTITLNTRDTDPTLEVRRPYLIRQGGEGATSVQGGEGAVLQIAQAFDSTLAGQYAGVTAMLVDDSTWWVFGALTPA